MGTTAHVIGVGATDAWFDAVIRRLDELELRWSRFIPSSDVCAINVGATAEVAPETAALVEAAFEWSVLTGGLFQPVVHDALVAAGYDRSFERLDGRGSLDGVRQPGTAIDLGGIGKGAAADLIATELGVAVAGGCINLGGDLRAWGEPPDGAAGWHVAVEVPGHTDLVVGVVDGAVATSSTARRRWSTADGEAHHLIDPRTGRPATSALTSVTVVDESAMAAEVLAKVALIAGDADALRGAPALLCTTDGAVLAVNGMEAYLS